MELGRIVEAMKRNMPENSCVETHNGIQAAHVILVIESRKTEHQLVATHRKDKMSKIPGKRFKSRVMYHKGYIFHRNKIVEKTDTIYILSLWCNGSEARHWRRIQSDQRSQSHEPVALEITRTKSVKYLILDASIVHNAEYTLFSLMENSALFRGCILP
jgi:hypothetical protein